MIKIRTVGRLSSCSDNFRAHGFRLMGSSCIVGIFFEGEKVHARISSFLPMGGFDLEPRTVASQN